MYPALLQIGPIAISSLWFFIATGFLVSGMLFIKLIQQNKLKIAFLTDRFFKILIYGLIGSRVIHILENRADYIGENILQSVWAMLSFWDKGFSFWGFIVGIVLIFFRETKKEQESFWKWMDMLVIALLAGMIFGNIGAFLEGVNYGRETTLPWGITFQNFYIPYTIPIHPSQIYAIIYTGTIFGIIVILFLKQKFKQDGDITLWATFSYSALRFLEEFTRGEEVWIFLDLRIGQWISLMALIISGILILKRIKSAIMHRDGNP